MGSTRVYRLVEGTLVVLFFWQAVRVVFAVMLAMASHAIATGQANLLTINAHLMVIAALALSWFAPRSRGSLPRTLLISSVLTAVMRIPMSIDNTLIRLVAGVAVIGFGGMYLASLIRANWQSWVTVLVLGLTVDLLFRAADSYDPSIKGTFAMLLGETTYRVPWLFLQIPLSLIALLFSWLARRFARSEPYEPASLTVAGGIGVGGFFTVEMLVLGMPNVIARWAGVSFVTVAPWLILFTALPLVAAVRTSIAHVLGLFDDRLRGWVWLLLLILVVVAGNRVGGTFGAAALVVGQFVAILTLWWIPHFQESGEMEQVGPSFSLGLFLFAILVYTYSLTFENIPGLGRLRDQGLILVLVGAGLLGLMRLLWREDDPWMSKQQVSSGLSASFVVPAAVAGLLLATGGSEIARPVPQSTISIATYNLNAGFDADAAFQLELAARTIEASLADVVVLQDVDAGRPVGLGVDQAEFLSRRLKMYQAYQPGSGKLVGVAVLSKWPITERRPTTLPGALGAVPALRVTVRDPAASRVIYVVAAQLAPGSEQSRLNQLYTLQSLAGESSPLVIAIDLGASPDDATYQQLIAGGFLDPDVALGIERGFTTPAANPTVRHDYVFVRGLIPLASRHVNSTASTHRLVVVEVGFPQ